MDCEIEFLRGEVDDLRNLVCILQQMIAADQDTNFDMPFVGSAIPNLAVGGDNGCFKIIAGTDQGGETCHYLDNQYVMQGNVIHEISTECTTSLEAFVDEGTPFLAVSLTFADMTSEVVGYASYSEMADDSKSHEKTIIPLYELDDETGSVVTDFRNAPRFQVFEELEEGEES